METGLWYGLEPQQQQGRVRDARLSGGHEAQRQNVQVSGNSLLPSCTDGKAQTPLTVVQRGSMLCLRLVNNNTSCGGGKKKEQQLCFFYRATLSKSPLWAYLPPPATSPTFNPPTSPQSEDDDKRTAVPSPLPFFHPTPLSRQITPAHLITSLSLTLTMLSPARSSQTNSPALTFSLPCQSVASPPMVR